MKISGDDIKRARINANFTQEELAVAVGLKKDQVYDLEKGRVRKLENILLLAEHLGLTDTGNRQSDIAEASEPSNTNVTWLPILDIRASMGNGSSDGTERVIARWGVPDEDIPAHKGELKIITAVGDSMTPTVLPNQKVIIDTGHTIPSPEGIYAIHDGDDLTLKRVARDLEADEKTYIVSSDNPQYKSYRLKDQGQASFQVVGRMIATWVWS